MPEQGITQPKTELISKLPGILAASGMINELNGLYDLTGNTVVRNRFGDETGSMFSNTLSGITSGTLMGLALFPAMPWLAIPIGIFGGIIGAANGALKNYEKENDAFQSWYGGLYEKSLIDSEQRLATGVALAGMLEQERLLAEGRSLEDSYLMLLSHVEKWQSGFDAARGEGYIRTRENGLKQERDTYKDGLGAELETANRMIGGSQAYLENMSAEYQQEALRAVLMDADLSVSGLEWSDQAEKELARLADAYQAAKEAEEAGDKTAGLLVSAYLREAEMLAQAQYDSSSEAREAAETEAELIDTVRTIISPLSGWKNDYDVSKELKKGFAPAQDNTEKGIYNPETMDGSNYNPVTDSWDEYGPAWQPTPNAGHAPEWRPEFFEWSSGRDRHEIWKHGVLFSADGSHPAHEDDEDWKAIQEWAWGAAAEAQEYVPPLIAQFTQYRSQLAAARPGGPRNNEAAALHESARILAAWEARQADHRSVGDITVTVTGNEFHVKQQSDMAAVGNAIASAVERKMKAGVRR